MGWDTIFLRRCTYNHQKNRLKECQIYKHQTFKRVTKNRTFAWMHALVIKKAYGPPTKCGSFEIAEDCLHDFLTSQSVYALFCAMILCTRPGVPDPGRSDSNLSRWLYRSSKGCDTSMHRERNWHGMSVCATMQLDTHSGVPRPSECDKNQSRWD